MNTADNLIGGCLIRDKRASIPIRTNPQKLEEVVKNEPRISNGRMAAFRISRVSSVSRMIQWV